VIEDEHQPEAEELRDLEQCLRDADGEPAEPIRGAVDSSGNHTAETQERKLRSMTAAIRSSSSWICR
jgi:hypothetical protein